MALTLIDSLTLFDAIFTPPKGDLPVLPIEHMPLAIAVLQHILTSPSITNLRTLAADKPDQYIAWLLASLSPWAGHMDTKNSTPAAVAAAREGLKMMTKITHIIACSYRNYDMIHSVVQKGGLSRSGAGMFVRKLGPSWRMQYLCALILEAIPYWKEGGADGTQEVLAKYSVLLSQIKDMGLEEAHTLKTVLNVCASFTRRWCSYLTCS